MRIAFLITTIHQLGGTESAVTTQANALAAAGHDVEIISVYRPSDGPAFSLAPGVAVRDLVDTRAELPDEPALEARRLVRPGWDPTLDARGDVAVQAALPTVSADVLVTLTPALLALAAQLRPSSVVLVHQEHRASSQRKAGLEPLLTSAPRADVVALLVEAEADWLRQQLGDATPPLVVVPNAIPPGFRPRSLLDEPLIVAAGGWVARSSSHSWSLPSPSSPIGCRGGGSASSATDPRAPRSCAPFAGSGSGTGSSCPAPPPTWPANGRAPASRR